MGKQDGFLLYDRKDNKARSPKERVMDFNEFHIPIKEEERKRRKPLPQKGRVKA